MAEDVEMLKALRLRIPCIHCTEADKFLLAYVILPLKLVKDKCIPDLAYTSGVYKAELPLNVLEEEDQEEDDDKGVTGAAAVEAEDEGEVRGEFVSSQHEHPTTTTTTAPAKKWKRSASPLAWEGQGRHRRGGAKEYYGVTRGVNFLDVAPVLDFDLPRPHARTFAMRRRRESSSHGMRAPPPAASTKDMGTGKAVAEEYAVTRGVDFLTSLRICACGCRLCRRVLALALSAGVKEAGERGCGAARGSSASRGKKE
ncbi:hypothetical protein C8R47DRAFT_1218405 [Mycena vitilis]|nr:hypothetical protein C8R47DRAFT_1218405 [Mycena vitilis]